MEAIGFNPEVNLSHDQRAQLAHTLATPGFVQVNAIMRAIVDRFVIDLINIDEDDDKAIIAKHKLSKAAAQVYQLVINRINAEVQQFMHDSGTPSLIDPTEGIIDMGEVASEGNESGGLLEGFELNEQLVEEELNGE